MALLNLGEVRLAPEDTGEFCEPSRGPRRGEGIVYKQGGNNDAYIYAWAVLPDSYNGENLKVVAAFQKWSGNQEYITTKTYVDVVGNNDSIPEDTTGQLSSVQVSSDLEFQLIHQNASGSAGDLVLIAVAVYDIVDGDEVALHGLWLSW